jgi:hypothetical protein
MIMKSSVETVTRIATKLSDSTSNQSGLIIIKTDDDKKLVDLVISIANSHPNKEVIKIFEIDGRILGEHSWNFSSIKCRPRIRIALDGTRVAESSGLIFPQDSPIILLAKGFDVLSEGDQRAFAHLVDGEGGGFSLCANSILIAAASGSGTIEPGTMSRGIFFELA